MTLPNTLADGYHPLAPGKLATLVTYVEMRSRPDRPPRPAPAGVSIEEVAAWDVDSFVAFYTAIGRDWLWTSRLLLGRDGLTRKLADPGRRCWCPVRDGRRIGILEMDVSRLPDVEISFFGLMPEAIGGGLGGHLMETAIELAFGRFGARRLWLHTCHFDSPQALPFYMRMGFTPFARAVEVFDDARLLGLVDAGHGPRVPVIADARMPDPD